MKFYIVDCFAEEKYQGNELLVVIADRPVSDEEQQKIAREINFSETAFIVSGKQDNGGYDVRIWTPTIGELPFAGHPTLGTAYIIHTVLENGTGDCVRLNLKAGQIPVLVQDGRMTMRQNPPLFGKTYDRQEIAEVFGIKADDIREDYPVEWVSTGLETLVIPLKERSVLSKIVKLRGQFESYIKIHPECNCNHLFFTDRGDHVLDARCMMEDYLEDPATGSANGDLAGYMLKHNYFGSQDITYTVHQGEDMGRPSLLYIHTSYEQENRWLIEVGGSCHIIASGEWN